MPQENEWKNVEEFDTGDENFQDVTEGLFPRNANVVIRSDLQKRAAEFAKVKTGIPSPSAALGRESIIKDALRAITFPVGEAVNLVSGGELLPKQLLKEQSAPSYKPMTLGDIGSAIPDIIQGAFAEIGRTGGALVAPFTGPVAPAMPFVGAAAGSLAGSKLASGMREFSPELFGENLESVNIGGVDIPTKEFNLMMDAALPMAGAAARPLVQNFKNQSARALVKIAGRKAPEEIAQAHLDITDPARLGSNIDQNLIPEISSGTFGGPLESIEQIASVRGRIKLQQENAFKTREFLKNEVGLSEEELQDLVPNRATIEKVNAAPFRKQSKGVEPIPVGKALDPATARGVQMLAGAADTLAKYKSIAKSRYNYVRDNLAIQGNSNISLDPGAISSLLTLHGQLDNLITEAPELAKFYGGPKLSIEKLLEGATHVPELPISVDFNALVELNSQLKKGINRGPIKPQDLPVISTVNTVENAIRNDLRSRAGGDMLLRKYNEGSKAVALQHRIFNPKMEKMLGDEPAKAWPKIFKDPTVAEAFRRASRDTVSAQKQAIAHLIESSSIIEGGVEVFSPTQALREWKKAAGLRTLYTGKQRNTIEQFLKFASASTPDISDIGKFAVAMRSGNLVANVGTGFFSGNARNTLAGQVTTAALWFGGRIGLSKILLDPNAAAIATRLLRTPARSPRAVTDLKRLMQYLNGVKVTVNMGNHSFETEVNSDLISQIRFANQQAPNSSYDLLNQVKSVAAQ